MGIDLNHMGRLMHESWTATKRSQGFHGPGDTCTQCFAAASGDYPFGAGTILRCSKFHPDLIDWSLLPVKQQDINLHAFDAVLPYLQEHMRTNVAVLHETVRRDAEVWRTIQNFRNVHGEIVMSPTVAKDRQEACEQALREEMPNDAR